MVSRINKTVFLGVTLMISACSMQPMIDASLPPIEQSAEPVVSVPLPPSEEPIVSDEPKSEPQREIAVNSETQLPAAAQALINKAKLAADKKQYGSAVGYLERASKIAPKSADVYLELTKVYYLQNQRSKALTFAKKTRSLSPSRAVLRALDRMGL